MSKFLSLLSRLKDYKYSLTMSVICNILMTFFTVISIPMIIPFFQILFDREAPTLIEGADLSIIDEFKNYFINLLITYDKETALIYVCLGIGLSIFLKNLFRYLAKFFVIPIRMGVAADIRGSLYEKYLSLPVDFYSDEKKGGMITRLISDVNVVEISILQFIQAIIKDPLLIVGSIAFMLFIHPGLTAFVFVLMIVSGYSISLISRRLKKRSREVQESIGEITAITDESISGMSVIRAYTVESVWYQRFMALNNRYKDLMIRLLRRQDLASPVSEFLGVSVVVIVLYYGSHLVFRSQISPEVFFAFIFAFYNVIEPSKSLSGTYFNVQKGLAALERIDGIMEQPQESSIMASHPKVLSNERLDFNRKLEFNDIGFRYRGGSEDAISNFNLKIKKGEKIALVGASGSGKSTITKLLLKFYLPTSGQILIDGTDITSLGNADLRSLIGWVTQDAFLYHGSIAENIRFGREGYSDTDLKSAAEAAYANTFISNEAEGFDASVGERGTKFSGGEKQRLSIARALLANPPILVLDEPTSALDPQAETRVTGALKLAMENRTSIIIAHRMSTIKDADRIVVMDKGKIVGVGSHSDLLATNAIYKNYIELQNRGND